MYKVAFPRVKGKRDPVYFLVIHKGKFGLDSDSGGSVFVNKQLAEKAVNELMATYTEFQNAKYEIIKVGN